MINQASGYRLQAIGQDLKKSKDLQDYTTHYASHTTNQKTNLSRYFDHVKTLSVQIRFYPRNPCQILFSFVFAPRTTHYAPRTE
jgi:hypothetical protein